MEIIKEKEEQKQEQLEQVKEGQKQVGEEKIGQEQFYDLLLRKEIGWQAILYDLIKTEQLDPWDIDLAILAQSYLEKIRQLEEANFLLSSKILLTASLLLRIKSELLLSKYIKSLDEILFGKPAVKFPERIEIPSVPDLLPKTPLPRTRRITLQELMQALNKAIETEQRRIKKEIAIRQIQKEISLFATRTPINIRKKIKEIYQKIKEFFKKEKTKNLTFSFLAGEGREERIATFLPLLHLDNQEKIFLQQEKAFEEIYIWLKRQGMNKEQVEEQKEIIKEQV